MRALSLQQPWAYLVIHGPKSIENRSWNPSLRGRFYIHSSKTHSLVEYERAARLCRTLQYSLPPYGSPVYQCGGILGEANLVDVLAREVVREWKFEGLYGFVLEDRRPTKFVRCRGLLNFWKVPADVLAQLSA